MNPFIRIYRFGGLILLLLRELVMSSLLVARDVLRPGHRYRSAIVGVPLEIKGAAGISILANMVTLTPGTTSLLVSDDEDVLYVHAMNNETPEATAETIKRSFETRVMETLR